MKPIFTHIFLWIAIPGLLLTAADCQAQERGVAVLLSREIAPYVAMVEGLEQQLNHCAVQRFFLDKKNQAYSLGGAGSLNPAQYDVLVAVGPGALRYLQENVSDVPVVFGMVLNPQNVNSDPTSLPCGVSLNISIESQLAAIQHHLPGMTSLGVLFDPANNQVWFDQAIAAAEPSGLELIPLQVKRSAGRLKISGDLAAPDAILFIPDKTIIAKPVIQHIIKQAVFLRTPVVGYNQFFYDLGAALSFIIDYRKNGEQVAAQIEAILTGEDCRGVIPPAFETRINNDVLRILKLDGRGADL